MTKNSNIRWLYLAVGTVAMLFAGIIYAWSILKIPFAEEFAWSTTELSLNFTLTMSFFCAGGLLGAQIAKRTGPKFAIILSGILGAAGFMLTSLLSNASVWLLYATYGLVASTGIGIAYNVVIATVSAWFPDKKGLCSGVLMMGFGASALVLGNLASSLFESSLGWRSTYLLLGAGLGLVLILAGLVLKKPGADVLLPASKAKAAVTNPDMTPGQMLKRPSFYLAFLYLVFLTAVGSAAISFARDLALSVGAAPAVATTLVGVLSIFNGVGRIITGALFDAWGCRKTMFAASILTIAAAAVTLGSVLTGNLVLCVVGLGLTGLSYGASPTTASAFTVNFYGTKYFSTNMAIMVFNMMGSSFIATLCGSLLASSGGFTLPFIVLVSMAASTFVLNLFIKKP